jgi:demethylmenaquinone methyltransferase/2-methoxy-6-polyprenyl-1,4-benzoquinol methylase
MNRVLKNDGILYVLEVSKPDNHIIGSFFNIYYYKLVPLIGRISDRGKKLDGKYSAYEWLSESLKLFPKKKSCL